MFQRRGIPGFRFDRWASRGLALVLLLVAVGVADAGVHGVRATISLERQVYHAGEPIDVEVTFTNATDRTVAFLTRNTPWDGFRSDMFDLRWNGDGVIYEGMLVKRRGPDVDDYHFLAPRGSVTTSIELSRAYDVNVSGAYEVSLHAYLPVDDTPLRGAESAGFGLLTSNTVAFEIVGGSTRRVDPRKHLPVGAAVGLLPPAPTFTNCNAAEQKSIKDALDIAREKAKDAKKCLQDADTEFFTAGNFGRTKMTEYERWFGKYNAACYSQVLDNWCEISEALNTQQLEFICGDSECDEDTYAFVYPCDPYEIYLCDAFFDAPLEEGCDTKFGVLIHEMSHFKAVAGTDDHAYGTDDCMKLAKCDPMKAKDNADCYEYFAEKMKPKFAGLFPGSYLGVPCY